MEEGSRRYAGGKRSSSSSSRPTSEPPPSSSSRGGLMHLESRTRPLKTVPLSPPDFLVPQRLLVDSYLEKEIRFWGIVSHIPTDLDATNRTDVLRHIDRGKREDKVCCVATSEHDAIFSLSIHNLKISRRYGKEEIHLRVPIHKIAAVCYIRDDEQHLLCVKFGELSLSVDNLERSNTTDMCQLAVLSCDSKRNAEEVCSLLSQTFQLVYTDATMQFLDSKLCEAAAGMSLETSTMRSERSAPSTPGARRMAQSTGNLAFMSYSSLELDRENGGGGPMTPVVPRRRPSSTTMNSDSDVSTTTQTELLKDYVYKKLRNKLSNEELKIFATLVNKWKNNMSFPDFCDKIMELYGPPRKHLLADMRPFIPECDRPYFEAFLERVGLHQSSWHALANDPTVYARPLRWPDQDSSGASQLPAAAAAAAAQYSMGASRDSLLRTGSHGNLDNAGTWRGNQSTDSYVPKKT